MPRRPVPAFRVLAPSLLLAACAALALIAASCGKSGNSVVPDPGATPLQGACPGTLTAACAPMAPLAATLAVRMPWSFAATAAGS